MRSAGVPSAKAGVPSAHAGNGRKLIRGHGESTRGKTPATPRHSLWGTTKSAYAGLLALRRTTLFSNEYMLQRRFEGVPDIARRNFSPAHLLVRAQQDEVALHDSIANHRVARDAEQEIPA
jgi:hypothetical protein